MTRRSSPGLGQWLSVFVSLAVLLGLFYMLFQYSQERQLMPAGLTIGSIDVGGKTTEEVEQLLTDRYLSAPITLVHVNGNYSFNPDDAEMRLDIDFMLVEAEYQRVQQDYWSGFWGYLWDRPMDVEPIALQATHTRQKLSEALAIIATQYDEEEQPPQPLPASLSFQYGEPGQKTNLAASLQNIENALYRATEREARLVVQKTEPERPDIRLLSRLIVNHVQTFEGIISIYVNELDTSKEIGYQWDVAMSGSDLMRIPIAINALQNIDNPSRTQLDEISAGFLNENVEEANRLLDVVAGQNDHELGAVLVTESLQELGLTNSFMLAGYDETLPVGREELETTANLRTDIVTDASSIMQTTAEDMGALLTMLYYCAEGDGGGLRALYPDELTQEKCQSLLNIMAQDNIGSLIEGGVPEGIKVAHRHSWINDTHADAGIVYTEGGDYVIVIMAYKPDWLEWELSSPMIADISRATYNYFNFATPFFGGERAN